MLSIVLVIFGLRMNSLGFHDLKEFQVSAEVHGFLMSWFVGFSSGLQILLETKILLRFYDRKP